MCLNIFIQKKIIVLLSNPDDISVKEELINVTDLGVNFYNKPKFEEKKTLF